MEGFLQLCFILKYYITLNSIQNLEEVHVT